MFCTALRAEIDQGHPGVEPHEAEQIRHVLDAPDSLRKRIVLRILERRATHFVVEHGYAASAEEIVWANIPWSEILGVLLKVLLALLPFIL